MELNKPSAERLAALREVKTSDFVLRDADDFYQYDVENWQMAASEENEGVKNPPRSMFYRAAMSAAIKGKWFKSMPVLDPELSPADLPWMRPAVVEVVGTEVTLLYGKVTEPDANFT